VPTSYYTAVQFVCRPAIIDDPEAKAQILAAQLDDFQSEGRHVDRLEERGRGLEARGSGATASAPGGDW